MNEETGSLRTRERIVLGPPSVHAGMTGRVQLHCKGALSTELNSGSLQGIERLLGRR